MKDYRLNWSDREISLFLVCNMLFVAVTGLYVVSSRYQGYTIGDILMMTGVIGMMAWFSRKLLKNAFPQVKKQ